MNHTNGERGERARGRGQVRGKRKTGRTGENNCRRLGLHAGQLETGSPQELRRVANLPRMQVTRPLQPEQRAAEAVSRGARNKKRIGN